MDHGQWDLRKKNYSNFGGDKRSFFNTEPKILSKPEINIKNVRIMKQEDWRRLSEDDLQSNSSRTTTSTVDTTASDKTLCCQDIVFLKISIAVFAIVNVTIIAVGGIGFTLGLVDYWDTEQMFTYVMVGSTCMVCWGTLGATMDMLAFLGFYKGKKDLLVPWLIWYLLEIMCFVSIIIGSTIYTRTYYVLPGMVKVVITIIVWIRMKEVHSSAFGHFNTMPIRPPFY